MTESDVVVGEVYKVVYTISVNSRLDDFQPYPPLYEDELVYVLDNASRLFLAVLTRYGLGFLSKSTIMENLHLLT